MHSRGTPATMQRLPPVADIISEVIQSLSSSVTVAERRGVKRQSLCLDPGIGFGKTRDQNVELIANLDQLISAFPAFPILIGPSRKSFIGHLLADANGEPAPVTDRLHGTMACVTTAILHGAHIIRVHDVKGAVETARVADAIKAETSGLRLKVRRTVS
jgi:dihydropteroate synthase